MAVTFTRQCFLDIRTRIQPGARVCFSWLAPRSASQRLYICLVHQDALSMQAQKHLPFFTIGLCRVKLHVYPSEFLVSTEWVHRALLCVLRSWDSVPTGLRGGLSETLVGKAHIRLWQIRVGETPPFLGCHHPELLTKHQTCKERPKPSFNASSVLDYKWVHWATPKCCFQSLIL